MAAAAAAVAYSAIKLLEEVRLLVREIRRLGRTGEEALRETGERLRSAAGSLLSLTGRHKNNGKNK